jgi:ABC-type amino acid transport substrate-binding protein
MLLGPRVSPRQIKGLADVTDLRFGVEGGSFADAILMLYQNGRLVPQITHFAPGGQVLSQLETGDIDATFLSLARFDAYRLEHPDTKIRDSGFNYPVAFNLGYAALASRGELIAQINTVLADMRASGEIADIAKRTGVTYVAPIDPAVSPGISFAQLEH